MKKYYFIGFVGTDKNGNIVYSQATAEVTNKSLLEIGRNIQRQCEFVKPATILCLKDLSKKEYEMLKGGEQ